MATIGLTEPAHEVLPVAATTATSLGHLAVHHRPGEGALAARFFQLLGARVKAFPRPPLEPLYIISVDSADPDRADDIVFLFALKPQQIAFENAIAERFGLGTDSPDPLLQEFLDERARLPESYLHFGLHFAELEQLEDAVLRLQAETAADPAFGARIQSMQLMRARGEDGDDAVAARMDASPVFATADQLAYGRHGVQVHIRTDLFATGLHLLGSVVELDYVFTGPGRVRTAFNTVIPD